MKLSRSTLALVLMATGVLVAVGIQRHVSQDERPSLAHPVATEGFAAFFLSNHLTLSAHWAQGWEYLAIRVGETYTDPVTGEESSGDYVTSQSTRYAVTTACGRHG